MRIVEINGTNYASTGSIVQNIAKKAREENFDVFTCCKKSRKGLQFNFENQIYIGTRVERIISEELAYITGYNDAFNYFGTKKLIKELKEIKPNLIHLHVMHNTYINHSLLFKYIKENNIPVVWTFHDCSAFTGKCPYFEKVNCNKWKNECENCPLIRSYPENIIDKTKYLYNKKKSLYSSINNMTVVTPSHWLLKYVKESFFQDKKLLVINNGINLEKYAYIKNEFKEKNGINKKFMLLGVANTWSERKGLDTFIELSKRLSDKYVIVLVGTNEIIDKNLPKKIISIHKTYDVSELVKIYSAADIFVNPTMEENFPTVNIESLSCGLPVVTYNTGGSSEMLDAKCGSVVEKGNIEELKKEIERICENKVFSKDDCINKAKEYSSDIMCNKYINLYKEILNIK